LQKKLSSIATLVFIDAPYVLPLWYKANTDTDPCSAASTARARQQAALQQQQQPASNQQLPLDGQGVLETQPSSSMPMQSSTASPAAVQHAEFSAGVTKPKRAWLLSEDLLLVQLELQAMFARAAAQESDVRDATACSPGSIGQQQAVVWTPAPAHITTEAQYTTQALGWDASWQVIQAALTAAHTPSELAQQQCQQQVLKNAQQHAHAQQHHSTHHQLLQQVSQTSSLQQQRQQFQELQNLPPIDGILGFSQGAAVAACVAALCQQQQRQQQVAAQGQSEMAVGRGCVSGLEQQGSSQQLPQLKFVLIASGFVSPAQEHRDLLQQQAPIALPSLHIFASGADGGSDRQIQQQMSEQLLELFDESSRCVVTHAGGHMVPSAAAAVAEIKAFLQQFT
jgi:hypothetical protein